MLRMEIGEGFCPLLTFSPTGDLHRSCLGEQKKAVPRSGEPPSANCFPVERDELFRLLERAAMGAAVDSEAFVFFHTEPAAMLAAACEVLDLDFETRNAITFCFFFFGHFVRSPHLLFSRFQGKNA